MKTLLVSSNPEATVPSKGYDLYVHFNSAKHFSKTPPDKSILVVRSRNHIVNPTIVCHAFCLENCYLSVGQCNHECAVKTIPQEIIVVGWKDDLHHENKLKKIYLDHIDYAEGAEPTSGMAAIDYFLKNGHEVTVCGFDLAVAPYRRSKIHNITYEIKEVKNMIKKKIIKNI
jgi:hypothetical protein